MTAWIKNWKTMMKRHLIVAIIAMVSIASVATYEFVKPIPATAAAAPSVAPLEDNKVGALLSLDQAMETLAARATPAIVNVTVTSRRKADQADGEQAQDMQQFFGPFG